MRHVNLFTYANYKIFCLVQIDIQKNHKIMDNFYSPLVSHFSNFYTTLNLNLHFPVCVFYSFFFRFSFVRVFPLFLNSFDYALYHVFYFKLFSLFLFYYWLIPSVVSFHSQILLFHFPSTLSYIFLENNATGRNRIVRCMTLQKLLTAVLIVACVDRINCRKQQNYNYFFSL